MNSQISWKTLVRLGVLALTAGLALGGVARAASVEPYTIDQVTGGPGNECAAVGDYVYAYKIDDWDDTVDGDYVADFDDGHTNTITIDNNDGKTFDWSATNSIGAVLVKASTLINVFEYDPQAYSDSGLWAPDDKDISHVTFCWNPEDACYEHESGWADGDRYVRRGSWATYTTLEDLDDPCTTLYAGQTLDAGEVCFDESGPGTDISIHLNDGWFFAFVDEEGNPYVENIHIEGYNERPPRRNPAPGQFEYKYTTYGSDWGPTTVDEYPIYGVHVVLMHEVECDDGFVMLW